MSFPKSICVWEFSDFVQIFLFVSVLMGFWVGSNVQKSSIESGDCPGSPPPQHLWHFKWKVIVQHSLIVEYMVTKTHCMWHKHRQFYRNGKISGTIDFIFGHSTTLIQNSKIIARKPSPGHSNVVVADGTKQKNALTGIVLQNCSIMADVEVLPDRLTMKTYLARHGNHFQGQYLLIMLYLFNQMASLFGLLMKHTLHTITLLSLVTLDLVLMLKQGLNGVKVLSVRMRLLIHCWKLVSS